MQSSRKNAVSVVLATLATLGLAARAEAIFHLAVIDEVLSSYDGDPEQQFVEIQMLAAFQTFTTNSVLASFDENGTHIEDLLVVPADLANGGAGLRWVMATEAFQEAHDFTADFTMPPGLPLEGGMICWGAPGIAPPDPASWDHTDPNNYVDCLAYGSYSGPTNNFIGNPNPIAPAGHSLVRVSETHDNAIDFACSLEIDATNNSDQSATLEGTSECEVGRASGIQVTPDEKRTLINKDVGDERWAITRNLDDLTVTGNVFRDDGSPPLFLFCEQTDENGDDLVFDCFGADRCGEASCPAFQQIATDLTLPESFFLPPVDAAPASPATTGKAAHVADEPTGLGERESGIQITPDDLRTLINKDVGSERWAITRNLDDSTVTGNVFFSSGEDPLFLFCEQTGMTGTDLIFDCSVADRCSDTGCPAFQQLSEVTLPESFFAVPGQSSN